jgi:CheY-like chemotaxis protein
MSKRTAAPAPLRVLVVDDDEQIRGLVALALLDEGFEVLTAADGLIALTRLEDYPPDVILLDMHMPEMDGWQFARTYRQRPGPHAPIVVFTAGGQAAVVAHGIGADGFVEKPFDLDTLGNYLARLAHHPTAA